VRERAAQLEPISQDVVASLEAGTESATVSALAAQGCSAAWAPLSEADLARHADALVSRLDWLELASDLRVTSCLVRVLGARERAALLEALPRAVQRDDVVAMAVQVDRVLADFVRGQLTVMGIMAALYGIGYMIIGVPLAVPIGVLAGFLTFVPYVGSATALVFGLLMTLLHFTGWGKILAVIGVYVGIQILDGILITPRVVGGRLGLSPVWVLFALMAFGQLFGFVGVMLALPMSAVIKVFVVDGIARYRKSELYLGKNTGPLEPSPPRAARLRIRRARRDRVRFGASS
jgi:hypothetical protein